VDLHVTLLVRRILRWPLFFFFFENLWIPGRHCGYAIYWMTVEPCHTRLPGRTTDVAVLQNVQTGAALSWPPIQLVPGALEADLSPPPGAKVSNEWC
jgi:hypothetical protein